MKKKVIFYLGLSLIFLNCTTQEESTADVVVKEVNTFVPETNVQSTDSTDIFDSYSSQSLFSPEYGWGYQILNNGELYINQPHIPSVQGNNGFESEEKALKTANFVVYKLNNGIFPPTLSPEELDSLNVLN